MTYPSAPRIHGNGFLQVDLSELHRLHVWDVRLPRQRTDSSIHDHAFSFESAVLEGTLLNVLLVPSFDGNRAPSHNLYRVIREPGTQETRLKNLRKPCRMDACGVLLVNTGDRYRMPAQAFHYSGHLGTTVTLMRRDSADYSRPATVACRIGERPDNSWVRGEQDIPDPVMDVVDRWVGELRGSKLLER